MVPPSVVRRGGDAVRHPVRIGRVRKTTARDVGGAHGITEVHQVITGVVTGEVQFLPHAPVVVAVSIYTFSDLTVHRGHIQLVDLAYLVEVEIDVIDVHVVVRQRDNARSRRGVTVRGIDRRTIGMGRRLVDLVVVCGPGPVAVGDSRSDDAEVTLRATEGGARTRHHGVGGAVKVFEVNGHRVQRLRQQQHGSHNYHHDE